MTFPRLVVLLALLVASTDARALDLPVRARGAEPPGTAYYDGSVIELRLTPAAARAASVGGGPAIARPHVGVASLDGTATTLGGVYFRPEFPGEVAPAPESGEPDFTAYWIAELPPGADFARALARFRADPAVAGAEPVAVLPVDAIPNDSLWNVSTWYYNPSTRRDIHAPEAWDVTLGDTSIVIGIIDTGVIPYHPDLGGVVAGHPGVIAVNAAERDGVAGVDDDGNGYVDDVSGWDFVALASGAGVQPGEDWRDADKDPNDYAGHGTAVAGIAAALTDNTIGVAGTARAARVMPLRIGWSTLASPAGEVRMDFAAQAIRYATRAGVHVINCSFATLNQSGLDAAVRAATRAGVVVVSAAGNNNSPHFLGDQEDVIAVTAVNHDDLLPSFANRGPYVDFAAPGVDIRSTYVRRPTPDSLGRRQPDYSGQLSLLNGTSFAAPMAAGTVALLQAQARALGRPPLTPMTAVLRLRETTDDIAALNPNFTNFGTGRLNAERALLDPPTSYAVRGGARSIGHPIVLEGAPGSGLASFLFATSDGRLIEIDAADGDTLRDSPLGAVPVRQIAGADMGAGVGLAFFAGLGNGRMLGVRSDGTPLPGFPVQGPSNFFALAAGPALGDLDGDGSLEIVCGAGDGRLYAWHADGNAVAGFPVELSPGLGLQAPPALAHLDAAPGVEIVAGTADGMLFVIGGDGQFHAGWPQPLGAGPAMAPLVIERSAAEGPLIVCASDHLLRAFTPAGTTVIDVVLPARAAQDPALGDLDGDGRDELVLATTLDASDPGVTGVYAFDDSGRVVPGWPQATATPSSGALIAPLGAGGAAEVLVFVGNQLIALRADGTRDPAWPRPGGAGLAATIFDAGADGRIEIAAGTGVDSSFFVYRGASAPSTATRTWPTGRGNAARTGTRLYAPPIADTRAPATIADLRVTGRGGTHVAVTWSAPADDGPSGRAALYQVRRAFFPLDDTNFLTGKPVAAPDPPGAPGATEDLTVTGLQENVAYWIAVRSRDAAGNFSAVAVCSAMTTVEAPGTIADLRGLSVTDSSVTLAWTATGDDGVLGRPDHYEVRASPAPIDATNFDAAPIAANAHASVDAGEEESYALAGLARASHYYLAVRPVDDAGARGPVSNVVDATTSPGGALAGRAGVAIGCRAVPGAPPLEFDWQSDPSTRGVEHLVHVYDMQGRLVRVLHAGTESAGVLTWNGRDEHGRLVPAGVYFARLSGGSFRAQTRVVLLP